MGRNRMKEALHHLSSGKHKFKGQRDPTAQVLERPSPRTQTPPAAGRAVERQERSPTAGGDAARRGHLGDNGVDS